MGKRQSLTERLAARRPLLLDGAVNTELGRKGLVFNSAEWLRVNIDSPESIAAIHGDYARAGAELHIANSFATARHVLEPAGLSEEFAALNRAAVGLCRDAIDDAAAHPQWIAGSLSTFAQGHDRNNLPGLDTLERNLRDQGAILADAGCDMLALEMLFDVETSGAMLRGAESCGLPVSLGLVCAIEPDGALILEGSRDGRRGKQNTPLAEALPRILDGAQGKVKLIVSVMHSELADTGPALDLVGRFWDGDIAVYPNNGHFAPPGGWSTRKGYSPAAFADACEAWLRQGATIVGGCCGVGPEHIGELCRRLKTRNGEEGRQA